MTKTLLVFSLLLTMFLGGCQTPPQPPPSPSASELHGQGVAAFDAGNYRIAADLFKQAIGVDPNFAPAFLDLGRSYGMLGMFDKAIDTYKRGLEIRPYSAPMHLNLGALYLYARKYVPAEQHLRKAVDLDPASSRGYFLSGELYKARGNCRKAQQSYRKALSIRPSYPDAQQGLREARKLCTPSRKPAPPTPAPKAAGTGGGKVLKATDW